MGSRTRVMLFVLVGKMGGVMGRCWKVVWVLGWFQQWMFPGTLRRMERRFPSFSVMC